MSKIRKPGRALLRTYIQPRATTYGIRVQARVVDVRTGRDIKCSRDTTSEAVACAKAQALAKPAARSHKKKGS